ncbi:hypothetical protein TMatcc_006691 [Talaromyces marneffei ATCC 18224]|uniref:Aspergillopepsin F, putative n=1 Tax=Talaromyces marneffei (strain ATCC 18224 / CBS 334.59 / QM 7333) TaxID=441960 RepID=B6Q9I3_TALMQ|nr:aspergillopepsin F precursor, putative [Talaromyces marneffei ATCC 18224]
MVNHKTIVSALALLALATSAPTLGSSFSINQVPINVSCVHPAAKYAWAYTKYGVNIPDYLTLAARSGNPGQAGSVTADPCFNDAAYLSLIRVGNNELLVDLDTGSSDMWVKIRQTPTAGPRTYDPITGVELPNHYWHIKYGDGSTAGGRVYKDKIQVSNVTYPHQAIEVADYLTSQKIIFRDVLDGVMGLAFPRLNTVQPTPQNTFYENVKESLDIPVFAAYLKHRAAGTFDFGYIDSQKYTGEIIYKAVDPIQGFWNVTLDGFSIGFYTAFIDFQAVVDTGSSLLLFDDWMVSMYYTYVATAYYSYQHGGWVFDCKENIPPFTIIIGQHDVVIPPEYIKYAVISGTVCYGGIQPTPHDYNILGDIFLKTLYVIFDNGTPESPRLGFAKQA